jgi:hypothetical protein
MKKTLKMLLGIIGVTTPLVACGPNMPQVSYVLPVGSQLNLVPFKEEAPLDVSIVVVSREGKPVSAGEVRIFTDIATKEPFLIERIENQKTKDCAAAALKAVTDDLLTLVFCTSAIKPHTFAKLEFIDTSGDVRRASHVSFVRSDKSNAVNVYTVDFL